MIALKNYIQNGHGRGLKYFFIFSLIVCIGCSAVGSFFFAREIAENQAVNEFLNRMPVIRVVNGQIVEPQNAFIFVPFIQGFNSGVIINTTDTEADQLTFDNGIYFTKDKMIVKLVSEEGIERQEELLSKLGDVVIDKAYVYALIKKIANVAMALFGLMGFMLLWGGYALLVTVSILFFLIWGRKLPVGLVGRTVCLTWGGIVGLDLILLLFGYGFSLPAAFGIALALTLVVIGRLPTSVPMDKPIHSFFDASDETPQDPEEELVAIPEKSVTVLNTESVNGKTNKGARPVAKKTTVKKTSRKKMTVRKTVKKTPPQSKERAAKKTAVKPAGRSSRS